MSEEERVMWQPQTVDDCAWLLRKMRNAVRHREDLETQHKRRIDGVDREIAWCKSFEAQVVEIIQSELERKGSRKKSIDLHDIRIGTRSAPPSVEVDVDRFASWLRVHGETPLGQSAIKALRAPKTLEGEAALKAHVEDHANLSACKGPLLELLKQRFVDEDGVIQDLPAGVTVVPATEKMRFE